MYDYLVFIGRFQPFHIAHLRVIEQALAQARAVIVLIGSSRQPRNLRNPFTVEERMTMMRASLPEAVRDRVHLQPLEDCLYNDDVWVRNVQEGVQAVVGRQTAAPAAPRIGLIGHMKDESSYYLRLFPQWDSVPVENIDAISATPLRDRYLLGKLPEPRFFPEGAWRFLEGFMATEAYADLRAEAEFIAKYRSAWDGAPYPPTFVTVDALVIQAGHILLVERKARPGMGLWALPGGFLDPKETLLAACIRELREETRLKVPEPVLKGAIKGQQVFDDPYRSARGRTITHAFHFHLKPTDTTLPRVKGGDDARAAFWVPLSEVVPEKLFEDHYHIIRAMTGLY